MWKFVPLLLFFGLLGFLARGLQLDPTELPSAFIEKPAPQFSAPSLLSNIDNMPAQYGPESFAGEVWVFNIWASWCRPCIEEHPMLVEMKAIGGIKMVGLNYKDFPEDGRAWLKRFGNPFDTVLSDEQGGTGIDWGVYGVPETFIVDKQGNVRYKHVGPISEDDLKDTLVPLIQALKAEQV